MKFNKYQCFSSCVDCDKIDLTKIFQDVKSPYFHQVSSQHFFKCFCKTICTTTKRLDMRGSIVCKKIRRHLEDIDIPALLVFLKKNQDITHLNLANNNISDNGFINLLDHLLLYKNIEKLDLQNNNITEEGIKYLLEVGKDLEIKDLNLKANKFGVQASKDVALFLLNNEYILTLNVAEVNQTASSLIYFVMVLSSDQEVYNKTLKTLDISRPNPGCMYFFDSAHFADVIGHMLKHNTCLVALHLQKYNFSCHDIESMMSNAKYNNTLRLLDLSSNNIGDYGVDHITSWLVKRPALKILILCRNIITDHGARSLSFAIPFSKLLSLDISYNKITDDGMVNILNTLKKSPLLRQLKIFGNCIGHPTAKIIKRMLISQVLKQENIDIKPYKIDHRWHIARYEGDSCKKEYHDVPYYLSLRLLEAPARKTRPSRKYYKYTYSKTTELKLQHSTTTIISRIFNREHMKDCKCCYCLKCEASNYDKPHKDADHSDICTCCKCKGDESSDWSVDKSITDRIVFLPDPMEHISYILKRVNFETKNNILRWININEDILETDLKAIGDQTKDEESSSEDTVLCNCSWVQLSACTLQKLLQEISSKNLLIIPKYYLMHSGNKCSDIADEISSVQYCMNTL